MMKQMKRTLVGVTAVATLLGGGVFAAVASADSTFDPTATATTRDNVKLSKIINAPAGMDIKDDTFTFTFVKACDTADGVKEGADVTAATLCTTVNPADTSTSTFPNMGTGSNTSRNNTLTVTVDAAVDAGKSQKVITTAGTEFIPDVSKTLTDVGSYTHAGVYVYTVTETASAKHTGSPDSRTITNSQAKYTVRVYVENSATAASGLAITNVTVERTAVDGNGKGEKIGTNDATNDLHKVDPTKVKTPNTTDPTADTDAEGFEFANNYSQNATLQISKTVADDATTTTDNGNGGDKQKLFKQTAKITLPATSVKDTDQTFTAYVYNKSDNSIADAVAPRTVNAYSFTVKAGETASNEVTFYLRHGEYLQFTSDSSKNPVNTAFPAADREAVKNLPVGTKYVVAENDRAVVTKLGYTASAQVNEATKTDAAVATVTDDTPVTDAFNFSTVYTGTAAQMLVNDDSASDYSTTGNITAITNTYTAPNPTGILIAVLPYVLMIGIPVAAFAAWFAIRRKRMVRA
ncbi:hypothetical protein G1C94_1207 [Bifidobacterium sp. DSM 109963]|uniref:Streptococcal pilin isopeptide linker domain-containing protein n=2 Tax=Bifidobacterium panos TaxID=2675321 RepID=A0ABX1SXN3_9BIFI|nr:hypothetical protein [Bifidobacterium sp. DSM 109963]